MLRTNRLVLLPLDTRQLAARVAHDDFRLPVDGLGLVRFGPEHPGELLPLYPLWLAATPHPGQVSGTWTIIDVEAREAIGSVGIKGPATDGIVEIGYGLVPHARGRGFATEAVGKVCQALLRATAGDVGGAVEAVEAWTRAENLASQAVLRRCGFTTHASRDEEHEGALLGWILRADQ